MDVSIGLSRVEWHSALGNYRIGWRFRQCRRVRQYYNPHRKETMRLLALVDAQSAPALPAPQGGDAAEPAASGSSSEDQASSEANSTAPADVPVASAGPAIPGVGIPTRSDTPDPPVPAATPPSLKARVRPVRTVAYDGSDESDNDPRWERIG